MFDHGLEGSLHRICVILQTEQGTGMSLADLPAAAAPPAQSEIVVIAIEGVEPLGGKSNRRRFGCHRLFTKQGQVFALVEDDVELLRMVAKASTAREEKIEL